MHAENVAIISKEGNDVEDRVAGLMPDREEDPRVLVYQPARWVHSPQPNSISCGGLGQGVWLKLTGISVGRLLDILQGKANRRCAILWKLLAALDAFGRNVPAEDTDQHR